MKHGLGKEAVKWIVIISVIIISVILVVKHVTEIWKKEKIKELQADLLLVQAKVEIVKGKNNVNKDENPLRGIQVSKVSEKFKGRLVIDSKGISKDDYTKYYILRDSDLSQMDLQGLVGKNKRKLYC